MLEGQCIPFKLVMHITLSHIIKLRNLLADKPKLTSIQNFVDHFFSYLFEQGYLSSDGKEAPCIKIPNEEIEEQFSEK